LNFILQVLCVQFSIEGKKLSNYEYTLKDLSSKEFTISFYKSQDCIKKDLELNMNECHLSGRTIEWLGKAGYSISTGALYTNCTVVNWEGPNCWYSVIGGIQFLPNRCWRRTDNGPVLIVNGEQYYRFSANQKAPLISPSVFADFTKKSFNSEQYYHAYTDNLNKRFKLIEFERRNGKPKQTTIVQYNNRIGYEIYHNNGTCERRAVNDWNELFKIESNSVYAGTIQCNNTKTCDRWEFGKGSDHDKTYFLLENTNILVKESYFVQRSDLYVWDFHHFESKHNDDRTFDPPNICKENK